MKVVMKTLESLTHSHHLDHSTMKNEGCNEFITTYYFIIRCYEVSTEQNALSPSIGWWRREELVEERERDRVCV